MKEIKSIKATGEWVILEAREVIAEEKKTESGLILPGRSQDGQVVNGSNGKRVVDLFIHDIGPDAIGKVSYKKGDMIIADNYDLQGCGSDTQTFYICHHTKVKAVIEA